MLLLILIAIILRPLISAEAFPYLNYIFTVELLVFLGIYIIYRKLSFLKTPTLLYPVIVFCLSLVVSLIFSQNRIESLSELYKYITGLLLMLVAASFSKEEKSLAVRVVILSGLVVSFLAIYQYFFGFNHVLNYVTDNKITSVFVIDYLTRGRVFLPFVTPGVLGGYLAMVIPLALCCKNRIWLLLPLLFALLLTKSIAAFLSLFLALIIYVCLRNKLRKVHILGLLGLFLATVIIFIWRSAAHKEYIQPVFSSLMRLEYWKQALEIIRAHPLAGVGLGNFNLQLSRHAHNSYLQVWAETGVLGLFSFLWIVYAIYRKYLKNRFRQPYNKQALCLFIASSVFLINNLFDFSFFLPEVVFVWWVILGLVIAPD